MPSGRATTRRPVYKKPSTATDVDRYVTDEQLVRAAASAGFGRAPGREEEAMPGLAGHWAGIWNDLTGEGRQPSHPSELVTAVAIALAEHRGKVKLDAVSATRDLGAWQINEPTWVEGGPRFDRDRLLSDLDYNAEAAFHVYKHGRRGFREWSTHPTISRLYRRRAANAVKAVSGLRPSQTQLGGNAASDFPFPSFGIDGIMNAVWPVLLKTAVAGTGLALIGWGIAGLFSSGAGEAAKTVAPVASEVAKR